MSANFVGFDWEKREFSRGDYRFVWDDPRQDKTGMKSRVNLRRRGPNGRTAPDRRYRKKIPIKWNCSEEQFRVAISFAVEQAIRILEGIKECLETLGEYLTPERWERIRSFFDWSLNTMRTYVQIVVNVFGPILDLPKEDIKPADINRAIEEKCSSRSRSYAASSIRGWLKTINRIFVYLQSVYPGFHNPVRMDGKKIREARVDEKKRIARKRISQRALLPDQANVMLFSFLEDIRRGDSRGIDGIMMMESGRRPVESGGNTLGMHQPPWGESFLSCRTCESKDGLIIDEHKNYRAKRQIPDSPVIEEVYRFYKEQIMAESSVQKGMLDWRTIPFGGKKVYENGELIRVEPFSAREISAYVKRKLVDNGINFRVAVDNPEEDTDDNRKAYSLRYTFATNLIHYLKLDYYQCIMEHRRSPYARGREAHEGDRDFYLSPRVQRAIYEGLKRYEEEAYGMDIIQRVRDFLRREK